VARLSGVRPARRPADSARLRPALGGDINYVDAKPLILLTVFLAAAAAGCGQESGTAQTAIPQRGPGHYTGDTQHRAYSDARGDWETVRHSGVPALRRLDLTRVAIRRQGGRLTVRFTTAAPPQAPMDEQLVILDERQVSQAVIQVRFDSRGVQGVSRGITGTFEPVPVRVHGAAVTISAPLTRLTHQGFFKWRATTSTKGEIVDRLPGAPNDVRFFPR
jgi:hypothetical protein